jgi:uncharacterized membrane protein
MRFGTSTDRLEVFSDGVIAIAITLLVLDIKVPHSHQGGLAHDLATQWPSFAAYVLSFAVIGIMWVSHHSMFERIQEIDRGLLFTNLLLLLGIAFLPFPTALLAEYARDGGSNAHVAAAFYSLTMTMIGLAFSGIWLHLSHHPDLLVEGLDPGNLRRSLHRSLVGPIVFALTIGLAFVNALACFVVYGLLVAYFAAGPSSAALRPGEAAADPPPTAAPEPTDPGPADPTPRRDPGERPGPAPAPASARPAPSPGAAAGAGSPELPPPRRPPDHT